MSTLPLEPGRVARIIFFKELRELLRDRRAVFFAFVVPLLLYPVLFVTTALLPERRREEIEARGLEVGVSGRYGDAVAYLMKRGFRVRDHDFSEATIRNGEEHVFVHFESRDGVGGDAAGRLPGRLETTVYYARTLPESVEARDRVREALQEYGAELVAAQFRLHGVRLDPRAVVVAEVRDVATEDEVGSARLGRLLPMIMVLLLLTGGSFAAIDLVAGEKERGTLETLYLHPVSVQSIVRGKFAVILVVSISSVLLNYFGMVLGVAACRWLGFGGGGGWLPLFLPPLGTLSLILVLMIPLAVFSSAVLLAVSAYAHSFREAQTYLLPVTLLAMLAATLGLVPEVRLASIVAVVPVANVALGTREALSGQLLPLPYLVALGSSSLYGWLALRKASALLHTEEAVLALRRLPRVEDIDAAARARRAIAFGAFMLLAVWYLGSLLQTWDFVSGLAATLWGVVLLPALAYPAVFRLEPRRLLACRSTPFSNYLWAMLLVPAAVGLNLAYLGLQNLFLPLPEAAEALELPGVLDLPVSSALFLFVVSPAICEEILWRGVFQGELEERRKPLGTVLLVGIFFGLFHLSIYRLLTTGMTGTLLAIVRHRTGSIFPCMLVHAAFNATIFFFVRNIDGDELAAFVARAPVWVSCSALAVLSLRAMRPAAAAPD